MPYSSKDELVQNRQLKVQELSIPFTIVGNATPASVVPRNDEPARCFLQTEGVDQITAALATNETATYTTAPVDATGVFRILVQIKEPLEKVVSACVINRVSGVIEPCFLGSATGITTGSGGGKSLMLACDSATALNAANTLNACLRVEYVVSEQ